MSSSDRRAYLTATVLNQALLDATSQDNCETRLETVVDIESSTGTIRASDRNKYVGSIFYEALLSFPVINRKISHWLQNQIEFSSLSLELSNVDARFNSLVLGGAHYSGFIGKRVNVSVGLRDVASTYTSIFAGAITDVGGSGRTIKSLTFTARDAFDKVNQNLPLTAITQAVFPDVESDKIGLAVPVVYGDWTTALRKDQLGVEKASVPTIVTNGVAAILATSNNVKLLISENDNVGFDANHVYLFRSEVFTLIDPADVVNVSGSKRTFEIVQDTGNTLIQPPAGATGTPENYVYANGDVILVRVVGKALPGGLNSNIVLMAQDILTTYGGFLTSDFDANWATFAAKASPAESAVANIPARVWVQEVQAAMQYALSLLAQVRLEAFVDRSQKLKLNSQHFDEWVAAPDFTVRNWDVVKDTFKPSIDSQNNFNRARALYDRAPTTGETAFATGFLQNPDAIAQVGKMITKEITFPNLYVASDVTAQLGEIIKLASAQSELVAVTLTSRAFLRDLGDWVKVSVKIGSTIFDNVPAQVREIGYDPAGLKVPVVLWSMQAVPFPGWAPGYVGLVGGSSATITAE